MNKYGYVLDNPLRYVDPDGHQDGDSWLTSLRKLAQALGLISPDPIPDPTKRAMAQQVIPGAGGITQDQLVNTANQAVNEGYKALDLVIGSLDPTGVTSAISSAQKGDVLGMVIAVGGMAFGGGESKVTLGEAKGLVGEWGSGTFKMTKDLITHSFEKHGAEVGAKDVWQFLRKASAFNTKGAARKALEDGATRYTRKDGTFIIKDTAGKIVSYGRN